MYPDKPKIGALAGAALILLSGIAEIGLGAMLMLTPSMASAPARQEQSNR